MNLVLTIDSGSLQGQKFSLSDGFLTIGRDANCTVRFNPAAERVVSKRHAYIEARADGFYLTDNGSTNGTFLNGSRVVDPVSLKTGDLIQFGKNGPAATVAIGRQESEFAVEDFAAIAGPPTSRQPISASFAGVGLGPPAIDHPPPAGSGRNMVLIGVTIFALVFLTMIVAAILFASVGIVPAVAASFVAFVPAIFYLLPFMWLDRYDPEPLWLLALSFAWGALVAVLVSLVVNTIFGVVVMVGVSPAAGQIAPALISAPIIEEASKGFGVVLLLIFFRRYFDDLLDGIVFGGVIALGFATVENVMYYGTAIGEAGIGGLVVLFVLRGILSPFSHATFTVMTGIGCGISRESHNKFTRVAAPVLGYAAAVVLHAAWNGLTILSAVILPRVGLMPVCDSLGLGGAAAGTCAFLVGYFVLEVPLFLILAIVAMLIMRRQNKILNEMLAFDTARGLISAEHASRATSAFRGLQWLAAGLVNGKFSARRKYLRSVGKLGLSYWHIQRAAAASGDTASYQQNPVFREEIVRLREIVD